MDEVGEEILIIEPHVKSATDQEIENYDATTYLIHHSKLKESKETLIYLTRVIVT